MRNHDEAMVEICAQEMKKGYVLTQSFTGTNAMGVSCYQSMQGFLSRNLHQSEVPFVIWSVSDNDRIQ